MVQLWRSLEGSLGLLLLAALLVTPLALVLAARRRRGAEPGTAWKTTALDVVLVANAVGFAYVTLWPATLAPSGPPSLVPFADTAETITTWLGVWFPQYGWSYVPPGVIAMVGNLLMFAPAAALLRFRWPRFASFGATIGTTALAALVPEVCQLLLPLDRSPSVDDVILPVLGGAAAYGVVAAVLRLRDARQAPAPADG